MATESTERIETVLKAIPKGRVLSYGEVAALAGLPKGARLVVRVLHARSEKSGLPWHRVLRKDGSIALPAGEGFDLQKALLEAEGVKVSASGKVELGRYGWKGPA